MKKQKTKLLLFLLLLFLAIAFLALSVRLWENRYYAVDESNYEENEYDGEEETLYYNGRTYTEKDLETVLVIGVDKYGQQQTEGYINTEQSDFLMLLVLNHAEESFFALPINRDTMSDIEMLGLDGRSAGSFSGQLALAHTYGSGGTDSCRNTVKAVSNLLYDTTIDHYISVTMDVVSVLNDTVGGVAVEMMDDFTDLDPAMIQGQTVHLNGEQALLYIRSRASLDDSRNIHRMERQAQYITALKQAYETAEIPDSEVSRLMLDMSEYIVSDCAADKLSHLYDQLVSYRFEGFFDIAGESVRGETYMEFYVDDEQLKALVLELFYTPAEDE